MADTPSFDEFLVRLRQGDNEAARQLMERFSRRLLGEAQRRLDQRLRGKVDPDDVVNSAMNSVCVRLRKGQFDLNDWESLQGLLVKITLRKCWRWHERFLTQRRDVDRERSIHADEERPSSPAEPPDPTPDPAEAMILEETAQAMMRGLRDDEQRFVRLMMEGFSITEISKECGVSYERVWRTARFVKDRLKRMLAAGLEDGEDRPA